MREREISKVRLPAGEGCLASTARHKGLARPILCQGDGAGWDGDEELFYLKTRRVGAEPYSCVLPTLQEIWIDKFVKLVGWS